MKTFLEYHFDEDVYISKDNKLLFDYGKNTKEAQKTKLGKGKFVPYLTKKESLFNVPIYSIYKLSGVTSKEIIKVIKRQHDTDVNDEGYQKFLTRTAIYINHILKRGDIILIPQTSSFFLKDLAEKIKVRQPHLKIIWESFTKNTINEIKIDFGKYDLDDKTKRNLERALERAKNTGVLEMKQFPKQFTKLISNFLKLDQKKTRPKDIENKHVIILDDLMASGFTVKEMIQNVKLFNPQEITGITVFKT